MIRLQDPEKIREQMQRLRLCGRKILCLRMENDYLHTKEQMEETAYRELKELPEEERQEKSEYGNISEKLVFERTALTDRPLSIRMTGVETEWDELKIDVPAEGTFDVELSESRGYLEEHRGEDANVLFSPCIGHEIIAVEYEDREKSPYPLPDAVSDEIIDRIVLVLDNGTRLTIGGVVDFLEIVCTDEKGRPLEISFGELKKIEHNERSSL